MSKLKIVRLCRVSKSLWLRQQKFLATMLRNILKICGNGKGAINDICRFATKPENAISKEVLNDFKALDSRAIISIEDRINELKTPEQSVLDPCEEDISHVGSYLKPTFNFAAYINRSETLQQLVKLGVNLHKIEKKNTTATPYLMQLNFETDIKNHILLLHDLGLKPENIAELITKNPFIFRDDLENLQTRINYLKFKKFDDAMILRIVEANPLWLSFSTQDIDKNLGFFQKSFALNGYEVRYLATKSPKLITYNEKHIRLNMFVVKEEMGFSHEEMKQMILHTPRILIKDQKFILKTFEYLQKKMNIPLEMIAKMPNILTCREFRLRQRHQFLEKLGKAQFDATKPNYISPITMVASDDGHFATEVAGSSIQAFNAFLKTL